MTSFIQDGNNSEYPSSFMLLPGVEHHFGLTREFTKATFMGFTPIIPEEDKDLWISFSQEKAEEWLLEDPQELSRGNVTGYNLYQNYQRRKLKDDLAEIMPFIWKNLIHDDKGTQVAVDGLTCQARSEIDHDTIFHVVETESPSNPLWYYSPPLKATGINAVNFNVKSEADFRDAFEMVEATKLPTFREICPWAEWFPVCTFRCYIVDSLWWLACH
jgi:hypothetical protein